MNERMTDYRRRYWQPISEDAAAGYEPDPLGGYVLIGLVIYAPTSEKLRDIHLRALERTAELWSSRTLTQDAPPDPEQVARVWARSQQVSKSIEDFKDRWLTNAIRIAASPENLTRRDTDSPDDFYRRVADAHGVLSRATSKPTTELARRAGVPVGTAAAWVSRARARGFIRGKQE